MSEIKLIIADDHELFRIGLAELLKKHEDIKIVKSVADGFELMEIIKSKLEVDIILLDLTMPNMDGFEVLKELKNLNSTVKPIVISMHNVGNYIAKCAKMGAYGYLLKNTDESELVFAIRTVYKGKKHFGADISEKMIYKYGSEEQEIDENVYMITRDTPSLNVAQLIYEFILLALPAKKIHPDYKNELDDEDDFDTEGGFVFLDEETEESEDSNEDEEPKPVDPRWEQLLKLKNKEQS